MAIFQMNFGPLVPSTCLEKNPDCFNRFFDATDDPPVTRLSNIMVLKGTHTALTATSGPTSFLHLQLD